jgi:hypothetical protein
MRPQGLFVPRTWRPWLFCDKLSPLETLGIVPEYQGAVSKTGKINHLSLRGCIFLGRLILGNLHPWDTSAKGCIIQGTQCTRYKSYKGGIVQGTHCTRDTSYLGQIVPGTHCTRDPLYKGHFVQGTHCTREALYKGHIVQGTRCSRDALHKGRII